MLMGKAANEDHAYLIAGNRKLQKLDSPWGKVTSS